MRRGLPPSTQSLLDSALGRYALRPAKRKVFVSFHHGDQVRPGDLEWAYIFKTLFSDVFELFIDRSLNTEVDSRNPRYIDRVVRTQWIWGTSTTIVLCGARTYQRKWVDWEIYHTLDYGHALLGVQLPTLRHYPGGLPMLPQRLFTNVAGGYAHQIGWTTNPAELAAAIEYTIDLSRRNNPDNRLAKKSQHDPYW